MVCCLREVTQRPLFHISPRWPQCLISTGEVKYTIRGGIIKSSRTLVHIHPGWALHSEVLWMLVVYLVNITYDCLDEHTWVFLKGRYTPDCSATKFFQNRIKTAEQRRGRRQAEYGNNDVNCLERTHDTRHQTSGYCDCSPAVCLLWIPLTKDMVEKVHEDQHATH